MTGRVGAMPQCPHADPPADDGRWFCKKDAERQLNYVRSLRIRLIGNRRPENLAGKVRP